MKYLRVACHSAKILRSSVSRVLLKIRDRLYNCEWSAVSAGGGDTVGALWRWKLVRLTRPLRVFCQPTIIYRLDGPLDNWPTDFVGKGGVGGQLSVHGLKNEYP